MGFLLVSQYFNKGQKSFAARGVKLPEAANCTFFAARSSVKSAISIPSYFVLQPGARSPGIRPFVPLCILSGAQGELEGV